MSPRRGHHPISGTAWRPPKIGLVLTQCWNNSFPASHIRAHARHLLNYSVIVKLISLIVSSRPSMVALIATKYAV